MKNEYRLALPGGLKGTEITTDLEIALKWLEVESKWRGMGGFGAYMGHPGKITKVVLEFREEGGEWSEMTPPSVAGKEV